MTNPAVPTSSVEPLDITGVERRLGAKVATLQAVAEGFTRGARRALPFLARRRARLVAVETGPGSIASAQITPGPLCQIVLEAPGRSGWAALRLDAGALQLIIEGSLGGAAKEPGEEEELRPLTQLTLAQRALVTRVGRALGSDLADALREKTKAEFTVVRAECLRGEDEPPVPKDAVATECVFEGIPGRATLFVLASGDVLDSPTKGRGVSPDGPVDPRVVDALQAVPVEVVAELGRVQLGLRRVLSLRPGEVLRLSAATDDLVQVRVAGLPKLYGVPVISRGQLAIQITRRHGE